MPQVKHELNVKHLRFVSLFIKTMLQISRVINFNTEKDGLED